MAPNFQSSFIPKEPVTEEVFKKKKAGIFGILAVSLFVSSIVISAGLYVYKGILKGDIQALQAELAQAENGIDKETIKAMSQFSKKLNMAKSIVAKHQVISNFLKTLSTSTVSTVQFTDFNYDDSGEDGITVTLKGKANSYSTVALQEEVFQKNQSFKAVSFSNLGLSDKGLVSFDVSVSLDPQVSVYSP